MGKDLTTVDPTIRKTSEVNVRTPCLLTRWQAAAAAAALDCRRTMACPYGFHHIIRYEIKANLNNLWGSQSTDCFTQPGKKSGMNNPYLGLRDIAQVFERPHALASGFQIFRMIVCIKIIY